MSTPTIPENFRNLFTAKVFAHMATIMPDGTPQVTPVWVDLVGDRVLVNSTKGRVKDRNMRANPAVAIELQDPANAYRYVSLKGRVVEIREEGAEAHIHKLAKRYLGMDKYPNLKPGDVRVIYEIEPISVHVLG